MLLESAILVVISILAIFLLPGLAVVLVLRAIPSEKEDFGLLDAFFLSIFISILFSSIIFLILGTIGLFQITNIIIINLLFATSLVILRKGKNVVKRFRRPSKIEILAFLTLLVISTALYCHPSYEIGARHDIAVYINTAVSIGKSGSIRIHDYFLSSMPSDSLTVLYRVFQDEEGRMQGLQFPDFAIVDPEKGEILPLQPPLSQLWMATFFGIFGINGAFWATPFFGVLSIISLFFLARCVFGTKTGFLASILLAVSYPQVFFSQYSSPEIFFQFYFISGTSWLVFFLRAQKDQIWGWLSSMSFGLLPFIRIEGSFLIAFIAALLCVCAFRHVLSSRWLHFLAPLGFMSVGYLFYAKFFLLPYYSQIGRNLHAAYGINVGGSTLLYLCIGLMLLLIIITAFLLFWSSSPDEHRELIKNHSFGKKLWYAAGILFIAYILFLFLTSPEIAEFAPLRSLLPVPRGDIDPMIALSHFFTPIGVIVSFMGILLVLVRRNLSGLVLLLISAPFVSLCLYTIPNNPVYPWLMRRHITVVIPVLCIFMGHALVSMPREFSSKVRKNISKMIAIGITVLISANSIFLVVPLTKSQFNGYVDFVDSMANDFDSADVLFDCCRFTDGAVSLPLKYIYGLNSIYMWEQEIEADQLNSTLDWLISSNYTVYFLFPSTSRLNAVSNLVADHYDFVHVKDYSVTIDKIEWEWKTFNNKRVTYLLTLQLYVIEPTRS